MYRCDPVGTIPLILYFVSLNTQCNLTSNCALSELLTRK